MWHELILRKGKKMKINNRIEDLILKINIITDLDILLMDNKQVIYFIGQTDFCIKYLYANISKDLKDIQKFIKGIRFFDEFNACKIIVDDDTKYKLKENFTQKEKEIIESSFLLINKYVD